MSSSLVYNPFRLASLRQPVHRFISGVLASDPPRLSPADRIRQRNFDLLFESLERNGNPSRVWANYTNFTTFHAYERLPLELHREVLRKCTPSSRLLRASATRRLFLGNIPRTPHVYEDRFQTIIRNMRVSGGQPSLDDYNFILEQFAAVGHHFGAMQVYHELTSLGIVPRTKTFGLCLQAIAHRLTLPVERKDAAQRVAVTRQMLSDLVNAMRLYSIPFTSVNLDLTMRILKETTDMPNFEKLMKWGYGIDLANPDCPPLDSLGKASGDATQDAVRIPRPQPFSTAALNTTLDTLGRLKNIPRLVQTFEVLTNPLPRNNSRSSYDDEDDDDFGAPADPLADYTPPSAYPNTTTFNILLRHVSRAGYAVLARHYLLHAMDLEKRVSMQLRHNLGHMPLQEVPAPHFAINRGTLLSVFGESNRDKNHGLMRWLRSKIPSIIRKKQGQLTFYSRYQAARQGKQLWPYEDPTASNDPTVSHAAVAPPTPPHTTEGRPASIMARWQAPKGVGAVFDLDLEDFSTPLPTPLKTFDLELHLRVLKRDLAEIQALYAHIGTVLERTSQRVRERSARRIWRGRDIYVLTDGKRVPVSMARWERMAEVRAAKLPWGRRVEQLVFPWSDIKNQRTRERRPRPKDSEPSTSVPEDEK